MEVKLERLEPGTGWFLGGYDGTDRRRGLDVCVFMKRGGWFCVEKEIRVSTTRANGTCNEKNGTLAPILSYMPIYLAPGFLFSLRRIPSPPVFPFPRSFQSQRFPAGQTALQLPNLGLPVAQLRPLRLAHARVHFGLPARVPNQAALPLHPLVGLVQLLGQLPDFGRQVHAALDLEEHGGRRADGRHHAAGRFGRGRVQDRERRGRADLAGEGADRR